eukprot:4225523-Pyramimonas_sp.AAC.1
MSGKYARRPASESSRVWCRCRREALSSYLEGPSCTSHLLSPLRSSCEPLTYAACVSSVGSVALRHFSSSMSATSSSHSRQCRWGLPLPWYFWVASLREPSWNSRRVKKLITVLLSPSP